MEHESLGTALRAGFEDAPVGHALLALDGRVLHANAACRRILGREAADLIGRTLLHFTHADDLETSRAVLEEALRSGTRAYQLEKRYVRRDGSSVWVRLSATRVADGLGPDEVAFVVYVDDIGDRRRLEAELERGIADYRLLADHATDLISRHDLEGAVLWVSPASRALLGFEPDEMTGLTIDDLVHPDDRDRAQATLETVLRDLTPLTETFRIATRDGRWRWFEATCRVPVDESGTPIELHATSRDVTLRQTASRAAAVTSRAPSVEEAFHGFAGVLAECVDFDRAALLVRQDDEFVVVASAGRPYGGTPLPVVVDSQHGLIVDDGSCLTMPVVVAGEVRAIVAVTSRSRAAFGAEDLTLLEGMAAAAGGSFQLLQSLDRERELTRRLAALDRLRTDFLGMVAHDLRTPLAVVVGYADTLATAAGRLPAEHEREMLETIVRRGRAMATMVSDVLQLAELESGGLRPHLMPLDVGAAVRRTLDDLAVLYASRKIVADVEAELPLALADAAQHERLLLNLVDNALKFSPADEPVEVSVRRTGTAIEVAVTDRGAGLSADEQEQVFERFGRLSRHREDGVGGSGLGLYICRLIVEAHGGTIDVTSAEGEGSTFRYTLPLAS